MLANVLPDLRMASARQEEPYTISYQGAYVEIRHHRTFELTVPVARAIWEQALGLCRAHGCNSILRIGPPPDRQVEPHEAQRLARSLNMPGLCVAYCWDDYRPDRTAAIFADAAMEKGTNVRYFCSWETAVCWLNETRSSAAAAADVGRS